MVEIINSFLEDNIRGILKHSEDPTFLVVGGLSIYGEMDEEFSEIEKCFLGLEVAGVKIKKVEMLNVDEVKFSW